MLRSSLFSEWAALRAFKRLDAGFHDLVFYSEGPGDWPHLGPVIDCLLRDHTRQVSYLTSGPNDPGLQIQDENLRAFQIGSGLVRTILFRSIDCRHFIMTMPDLETFHLKRSVHSVHYIYLFHSINSTHSSYRKGAFDGYDTILCAGPHHVDEIRRTEAVYGLRPKELVEHGSVKLDSVLAQVSGGAVSAAIQGPREVLIAPSWGESSLIEQRVGVKLIDTLLSSGYRVVLRLHPMTVRRFPKLVPTLERTYRNEGLFQVEDNMNAVSSWMRSHVMISDWSGAAIEYSLSLQKPVIYINTRQKLNNPEWQKIGVRPFEDLIRFEIGCVIEPSAIATVPSVIEECCLGSDLRRERIVAVRDKWIFNVGRSTEVAARYLASTATLTDIRSPRVSKQRGGNK